MSAEAYAWIVIAAALVAANLPFLNERLLGVFKRKAATKSLRLRLFELLIFYGLVAVVAFFAERQLGPVYAQRWEFYATTVTLFVTLAFPGFVWRYLRKA
jgi:hypothetical protein